MLALKTLAFIYDPREDRILAAINASHADAWKCWLTRRMALALVAKADEFVSKTSKLLQHGATASTREQIMSFERDAALAETAHSLSRTPKNVIADAHTELLHEVTLNQRGDKYQINLRGAAGGGVLATLGRAELQRILQMLHEAIAKANWIVSAPRDNSAPEQSQQNSRH